MPHHQTAILVLADGTVFRGISIGAAGHAAGEVVFNTAMTGYQEILTDPSYCRQLVTLTYPHIGNTGINAEDAESTQIHAAGLVIRDLPAQSSNWRKQEELSAYLKRNGIPAIAEIDTRKLTRLLREKGAQNGCLMAAGPASGTLGASPPDMPYSGMAAGPAGGIDEAKALELARGFPGLAGMDLAKVVSSDKPYVWQEGEWALGSGFKTRGNPEFHVVAYDFGVKRNILRMLAERGCKVTVLPAQTPAEEALKLNPDGVFLSNGPGDPEPCDYAVSAIQKILRAGKPTFGICLGHQLLALASGAKTRKMKFGHHGANHPVQDLDTGRVMITSQNHGFAIDEATLPVNLRVTHKSLFDGSNQGIARTDVPAFSFQGHPEASPGPHDVAYLFDRFIGLMQERKG
ncbi:MAG: glutamine-hydrolyzing carbamoyl-phosphate synthase small subunit [Gammaproteobacteria bacterium]|nr:glutamine-hydrolyzing carbamoyl-phosphate synthase small subunit [Gammaproteobacteria bacterium]